MHLKDTGVIGEKRRDDRALVRAGGDDDIFGFDLAIRGLRNEAGLAGATYRHYRDTAADWGCDEGGIAHDEIHDLAGGCKAVRIGVRQREIRQPDRPVGKLESEAVPAFRPPTFGDPRSLKHEMRSAALGQHVAHRQSGVTTAHDKCLYAFSGHRFFRRSECVLDTSLHALSRYFARLSVRLAACSGFLRCVPAFPLLPDAEWPHLLANPPPFTHTSRG